MNSLTDHLCLRLWEKVIVSVTRGGSCCDSQPAGSCGLGNSLFALISLLFASSFTCSLRHRKPLLAILGIIIHAEETYRSMKTKLSFWNWFGLLFFLFCPTHSESFISILSNTNINTWAELRCFICPWFQRRNNKGDMKKNFEVYFLLVLGSQIYTKLIR